MPVNRNALIRYRTIDHCLKNRYRKWTLPDLIEACSEALYEYEGIDKGVSRRTVQMDIQMMRSDKLGYNAPIIVQDQKYYTYEDPNYSITNIPLTKQDLSKLTEVIEILKQFKGFTHFQELSSMVQKLEDKVYTEKTHQPSVVQFETNEYLKGLEFMDTFYQAIIKKKVLHVTYQSFKARHPQSFDFHPQLLKEFRNRWFVLGFKHQKQHPLLLALDRIQNITPTDQEYIENTRHNLQEYFSNVVGVSVDENGVTEHVELFVVREHAPYVLTKPIHHSQKLVKRLPGGVVVSLELQLTFELEKELLGFGETIKVLKPDRLVRQLKKRVTMMHQLYTLDLHPIVARETIKRVERRGTAILDGIYRPEEIRQIIDCIEKHATDSTLVRKSKDVFAIRQLLHEIPQLKPLLFNQKLCTLIQEGMGTDYFLCKAIYFDKPAHSNWYVTWHQDVPINVQEKLEVAGFNGWTKKQGTISVMPPEAYLKNVYTIRVHLDKTNSKNGALLVIPKSHYHILKDQDIQQLRDSKEPVICTIEAGGIHLMKPLTLHASSKTINDQPRRVIHLEFASMELPDSLKWKEKLSIGR